MGESVIAQIVVAVASIVGNILAVTLIVSKKFGGDVKVQNYPTPYLTNGAKKLEEKYDDHLIHCQGLWMSNSEFQGEIRGFMVEIRDKLVKLEGD